MPDVTSSSIPSRFSFLLLILLIFAGSCDLVQSDSEEDTECYVNRIQFSPFDSLVYRTISGGRVYSLRQERTVDEETQITESYLFNYKQDNIRIVDQMDAFSIYPFMRVTRNEEELPTEVIRYFSASGVLLFHDISYLSDNSIRIDLTREASTGDVLYVGYTTFQLNDDGNVVREQQFRAAQDDPTQFTPTRDRFYSYDDNPNPQDNLYLPFFASPTYPNTAFFSKNNVVSFTENSQTFSYQYDYGQSGEVLRQRQPDGNELLFGYANCSQQ